MENENFIWAEKYRPKSIDEIILPARIKKKLKGVVSKGIIPNLLLSGPPGTGKTTAAKAMVEAVGGECLVINSSLDRNIDTLRVDIQNFASSMSLEGGRKYVILDEADYLNPTSTQPALRAFIEEFSSNCGFILTCNYPNKILEPVRSRFSVIDFTFEKNEYEKLQAEFFLACSKILTAENIEFTDAVLAKMVVKYFPDFRRAINELQGYSSSGKIDVGILADIDKDIVDIVIKHMKKKDFDAIRDWVSKYADHGCDYIFRTLFENLDVYFAKEDVPSAVVTIAEYQYKHAFVADIEINMTACLVELMMECEING